METRVLILNGDPVFEDRALAVFETIPQLKMRIIRSLPEAIYTLMREGFDLFAVEGEPATAIAQAINTRQHFPSLEIICLVNEPESAELRDRAQQQSVKLVATGCTNRHLRRSLRRIISSFGGKIGTPAEGIDPCHSLVGNLDQFSAAEILQMVCMGQRSGRLTFKSSRGTSEIYLNHGIVRHAIYDVLEGESVVAEVFRWRQGRFFFEEGVISQVQTVNRPWANLLIDNLQKLDETLQMVNVC